LKKKKIKKKIRVFLLLLDGCRPRHSRRRRRRRLLSPSGSQTWPQGDHRIGPAMSTLLHTSVNNACTVIKSDAAWRFYWNKNSSLPLYTRTKRTDDSSFQPLVVRSLWTCTRICVYIYIICRKDFYYTHTVKKEKRKKKRFEIGDGARTRRLLILYYIIIVSACFSDSTNFSCINTAHFFPPVSPPLPFYHLSYLRPLIIIIITIIVQCRRRRRRRRDQCFLWWILLYILVVSTLFQTFSSPYTKKIIRIY